MPNPPPPPPRGPTPPYKGPTPLRPGAAATPPRGPVVVKPVAKKIVVTKPAVTRKLPGWLARARRLVSSPNAEWRAIAGEFTTAGPVYWRFLVPMAAIGPVAATVGTIISGGERSTLLGTYTISMVDGITRGVLEYALNLGATYLLAIAINFIAAALGGQGNQVQALKVAAYGSTPYWLGGALSVLPKLAPIGLILALYSVRLYAGGLAAVLHVPPSKTAIATLLTSFAAAVVVLLITASLMLVIGH